jgi:hypothetical protein
MFVVVAARDLDLTNTMRPSDTIHLCEDAYFDSPVRWEEQIIGNSGKGSELAGEGISEVGHVFQEVDLSFSMSVSHHG